MALTTPTLTVERVANGWLVRTDSGVYVATAVDEAADLCRRWVEATSTTTRPATPLDPPPRGDSGWMRA